MAWFGPTTGDCTCCFTCSYCNCDDPASETGPFGVQVTYRVELTFPDWIYRVSSIGDCVCPEFDQRINTGTLSGTYTFLFRFTCNSGAYSLADLSFGVTTGPSMTMEESSDCGATVSSTTSQMFYRVFMSGSVPSIKFWLSFGGGTTDEQILATVLPCDSGGETTFAFAKSPSSPDSYFADGSCYDLDFGQAVGAWLCE